MNHNPCVTVGIPAYNEEKYIGKTIESVLAQSYRHFKLIISDNCSIDRTCIIAEEYALHDSRIELIKQKKKISITENFKVLSEKTDTKYFMWLGAHDLISRDFLKDAIDEFEKNFELVLIYPKLKMIDKEGDEIIPDFHLDDDLQTTELDFRAGLYKVVTNAISCFAIHGVFRTNIAKELPVYKITSIDHLWIFFTALKGKIKRLDTIGIFARKVREESPEETRQRYIREKMCYEKSHSPLILHAYKHIWLTWKTSGISIKDKIKITYHLKKIFTERYKITWANLIKCVFIQ